MSNSIALLESTHRDLRAKIDALFIENKRFEAEITRLKAEKAELLEILRADVPDGLTFKEAHQWRESMALRRNAVIAKHTEQSNG